MCIYFVQYVTSRATYDTRIILIIIFSSSTNFFYLSSVYCCCVVKVKLYTHENTYCFGWFVECVIYIYIY